MANTSQEDEIEEKYRNMSRGERRRIYKANKKYFPDMSFTEFNERLPKKKKKFDLKI